MSPKKISNKKVLDINQILPNNLVKSTTNMAPVCNNHVPVVKWCPDVSFYLNPEDFPELEKAPCTTSGKLVISPQKGLIKVII